MLSSNPLLAAVPNVDTPDQLRLATVGTVTAAGVTLILPGASQATQKHYPRLASASVSAGDAVIIAKISGTWVVLGKLA